MMDNERMLMKQINEASFAVDDIVLYLDTHPGDREAMQYYHQAAAMRKEAVDAYEAQYGPLMADGVKSMDEWTWLDDRWPWEGEA